MHRCYQLVPEFNSFIEASEFPDKGHLERLSAASCVLADVAVPCRIAFGDFAVGRVFGVSGKPQVLDAVIQWVPVDVINNHSVRDFAVMHDPDCSMHKNRPVINPGNFPEVPGAVFLNAPGNITNFSRSLFGRILPVKFAAAVLKNMVQSFLCRHGVTYV